MFELSFMAEHATELLRSKLGPEVVLTDDDARFRASFDNARLSFLPEAVLRPEDEEQVGVILETANRLGIPITTRGGGTATTGAASPVKGGWVLDLSHWQNLEIDATAGIAYAQPGVRTADLAKAAEAEGWYYPPDPSSHKFSTIGGNIACNAGGMRGAKYGVTRDYVMALEGFLPTGQWVRWGADLRKFAAGYNLRDLWVGSEGTLGIITGAVLRLVRRPAAKVTFLAAFENERKALGAVKAILKKRIMPSVLEFLDRQSVECTILEGFKLPFSRKLDATPALLLIELDGSRMQLQEDRKRLETVLENRSLALRRTATHTEAERLWEVRRKCSKAMFRMGDSKLNEDVVVPLRSQEALLKYTLELKQEIGLATPTFGHAGDGNFHVHIMFNREDLDQRARAEQGVQKIMEKVIELGGAISGEHGIGLAKTPFLNLQHSPAEIGAMKAIKQALDPNGILNPGKIFEPFRVWEHAPVKVKMPWDH